MKRSTIYSLNAVTLSLVVLGIFAVINFVGTRHFKRFDFTRQKSFSLAPQSIQVVKALKDEVRLIGFYEAKEKAMFDDLLNKYKYHSNKIVVQFYDPDKDKGVAKKYNIKKYRTVVIEKGKRETRVEDVTDENGEEKITNAIIKAGRESTPVISFLKGHGEKDIHDQDREGYSVAQGELKDEGYEVKSLSLLESGKIPQDTRALIIAGPEKPFHPKELELISDYFKNGGRGMILLDPTDRPTGIETFLLKTGIRAENETIIDPISTIFGQSAATPVVSEYTGHDVVRSLKEASFYPLARHFTIPTELPNKNLKVEAVAKTTPNSWAEGGDLKPGKVKYDEGKDRKGPLNLVVAVSGKWQGGNEKETRLLVFGDSDFSNNRSFEFAGNGNFFLNAVAWLVGDESLISIRPPKIAGASGKLIMTPRQVQVLFMLSVVVVPLVIVGAGIIVWLRRRRLA